MRKLTTFLMMMVVNLIVFTNFFGPASIGGSLGGNVTDTKKSVVAGTSIRLVNRRTNAELTARTNDAGFYPFSRFVPGGYVLKIKQTDFQQAVVEDVQITVNEAAIADVELKNGSASETVVVEWGAEVGQAQRARLMKSCYGDHPEPAPPEGLTQSQVHQRFYAIRRERRKRLMLEVEQETPLAAQQLPVARCRVFSPAVMMQETLNDIAGTSLARRKSYVAQTPERIGALQAFLVPKLIRRELLKAADYDRIPRFQFAEEPAETIANRAFVGILLLLVPTVLFGVLTFIRLRRFSPLG